MPRTKIWDSLNIYLGRAKPTRKDYEMGTELALREEDIFVLSQFIYRSILAPPKAVGNGHWVASPTDILGNHWFLSDTGWRLLPYGAVSIKGAPLALDASSHFMDLEKKLLASRKKK
ncbi:MAG: hypothetical protein JSS72_06915 [Armatimonadetes bacterium]|nr:hypothetical protein [Armatimonadota bacterium]